LVQRDRNPSHPGGELVYQRTLYDLFHPNPDLYGHSTVSSAGNDRRREARKKLHHAQYPDRVCRRLAGCAVGIGRGHCDDPPDDQHAVFQPEKSDHHFAGRDCRDYPGPFGVQHGHRSGRRAGRSLLHRADLSAGGAPRFAGQHRLLAPGRCHRLQSLGENPADLLCPVDPLRNRKDGLFTYSDLIVALILHLETASPTCSVALSENGQLLAIREQTAQNIHARVITLYIETVMKEAGKQLEELDAVCVSKGPGSYTGLRIGVSTAKGLCYALDKPLIAVNTLEAMASGLLRRHGTPPGTGLCPMLDARRMEVFMAVYRKGPTGIECESEPQAIVLDE